jgi:dihydrofolate reductase
MIIAAIVATDINNAIGKNNQLLWHLPADLKFFKTTTMGYPVIIKRKTYESIARILPGRKNSIITRNSAYNAESAFIFNSIDEALKNFNELNEKKVFIIGGAEIYNQSLKQTTEVYRTLVKQSFEADTYFPKLESINFKLVWEECFTADEKNKYDYCFQKWERL